MDSLIVPPPEIRELIEGVASYIKENGEDFVAQLRSTEKNNAKYSFLNENDPYYPFYAAQIKNTHGKKPTIRGTSAQDNRHLPVDIPASYGAPKAPMFEHSLTLKPISAYDLDLIGLTSVFSSFNEASFLSSLISKEIRNLQFNFLRADHSQHRVYKDITNSYKQIKRGMIHFDNSFLDCLNSIENASKYFEPTNLRQEVPELEDASKNLDWVNFVIGDIVDLNHYDSFSGAVLYKDVLGSSGSYRRSLYGGIPATSEVSNQAIHESYVICPLCNGTVSSRDIDRHMRLELASSSSIKQRQSYEAKFVSKSTENSSHEVERNLSKMLNRRSE